MLTDLLAQLLKLDPYWILKVVFPLFYFVVVGVTYLASRPLLRVPWLRILAGLSPLCFPVILQEALISRPQTLVVLTLVPALYLLQRAISQRVGGRQMYWSLGLIAAGVAGLKIHTLFFLLIIGGLCLTVIAARSAIKKYPVDALLIFAGVILLLYPWLSSFRLLSDLWQLLKLFGHTIAQGKINLWFIDHYRNVDGSEAGWPGASSLLYYGYNLGLLLPVIAFLGGVARRSFWSWLWHKSWPVLVMLIFFVVIAEIMPRFGLAFLPDRAWLFITLALALLTPQLFSRLAERKQSKLIALVTIVSAMSLVVGTSVTYAKQGWTTPNEYLAADFIREAPARAVFITQGGNRPLVRYFGQRMLVKPPDWVFLSTDEKALEVYLTEQKVAYREALDEWAQGRLRLTEKIRELGQEFSQYQTLSQGQAILEELKQVGSTMPSGLRDPSIIAELYPTFDAPIYLLYSADKFNSLYGQRSWWRTSNFYGANLEKFTRQYPIVYEDSGVTIWEVRK